MPILYAWAVPAFFSGAPVDHTWVTTYDNRLLPGYPDIQSVTNANQSYWYCWGDFHAKGGTPSNPTGALGQQQGALNLSTCLVTPNLDSRQVYSARGTIFTYGVDGVCHQLANQVLYSTGTGVTPVAPLTVKNARGYHVSTFLYGTYGTTHLAWQQKIATCGGPQLAAAPAPGAPSPGGAAPGGPAVNLPPDDFEERARAVLGHESPLLGPLLSLRTQAVSQKHLMAGAAVVPSADTLNAHNQQMLDQAAALLGRDKFIELFGFPPEQKITLVDPTIHQP
jgi:hypothetical protein